MENAEEVMQLLEEFSKVKPKEIPRELEDYLGYVAKTGDPVFQWSLIKILMREKLLAVITDFYESTLTAELPPCPNVEPFNYDRMKSSLIERFDTFSGAPFTIQRICELLINPRKEYNRADKYMRAIEKNILVVSTREPGTGKRPLECDQSETVLNGMPDVKLHESDGSLLHVPTDLPYLGAPPASNDVTVETTEPNPTIVERVGLEINGEVSSLKTESDKAWPTQESHSLSVALDPEPVSSRIKLESEDKHLNVEEKSAVGNNCDSNSRLTHNEDTNSNIEDYQNDNRPSIEMIAQTDSTSLPDSIDSLDSTQQCSKTVPSSNLENDEVVSESDENEVSSSPANLPKGVVAISEEVEEPTDSEAEATSTESCVVQDNETEIHLSLDNDTGDNDKVIIEDETKTITISEITVTKLEEINVECNEVSGTVISPISPGNTSQKPDDLVDQKVNIELVEECEQTNSCPDSSNDLYSHSVEDSTNCELGLGSEADSLSEENLDGTETKKQSENTNVTPEQSEEIIIQEIAEELSPSKFTEGKFMKNTETDNPTASSDAPEEITVSEISCSASLNENTTVIQLDVLNNSELMKRMIEEMNDSERRDESVIQPIPNIVPDSQDQITIEEISVDPSCEAEIEAMDVDDCSNQMTISEGENEGEPMDEGDQTIHS